MSFPGHLSLTHADVTVPRVDPQHVGRASAHVAAHSLGRETYYVACWRESSRTISWSCQAVTASPEASAFLCRVVWSSSPSWDDSHGCVPCSCAPGHFCTMSRMAASRSRDNRDESGAPEPHSRHVREANTRLMLLIWLLGLEFRIREGPFASSTSPHECLCNATPRVGLCGFRTPCTVHVPPIPLVPRALWKYRRMAPIPCIAPSTHRTTPTHFPGGTVLTASPRARGCVSRRPRNACSSARGGYENRFHSVPS